MGLTSSVSTPLSRVRVSFAIFRRSISFPSLTISPARNLLSLSAFSYKLVISFNLAERSTLDFSDDWNLAVISLITVWLCSKSLIRTLTSPESLVLAFSAAFSFCSSWWTISLRPLTSTVNFFLRASTSSTRRRASFSYFFFQSPFSCFHFSIDPSRLILIWRSSSISTVRVLMLRSRDVILVSAALRFLASLSAARRSSSSWAASFFLELVISATLLLRSSILRWYSLTVISSFSTTFLMLIFSLCRISIWAYSSLISVFMTDFSLTTFSFSLDILSICSWSSIMEVWCLVRRV